MPNFGSTEVSEVRNLLCSGTLASAVDKRSVPQRLRVALSGLAAPLLRLSARFIPCRLAGKNHDARGERLRVREPQCLRRAAPVPKEALATPQDDREDHEPVLVHEVMPH